MICEAVKGALSRGRMSMTPEQATDLIASYKRAKLDRKPMAASDSAFWLEAQKVLELGKQYWIGSE